MKNTIACILAMIVFLSSSAIADVNVHDLSDDELLSVRNAIEAEISARGLDGVDFLADDSESSAFWAALATFNFETMRSMTEKYVNTYKPDRDNRAYTILGLLDRIDEYKGIMLPEVDDFDGSATLRFDGCTEISEEISVAPYLQPKWSGVTFGFIKKGWLFFDKLAIAVDGKVVYEDYGNSTSFRTQRDIIEGGIIREQVSVWLSDDPEIYRAVSEGGKVTIRFINSSKDEHYDHVFTEEEKRDYVAAYMVADLIGQLYIAMK